MTDPHRPIAHPLPESGWTNDPIGPIHWRGRTHLFSQVNPEGAVWDRPHWGHFVTDDLVHWQRRPVALAPDAQGPDADGCYSGCVVAIDEVATMFYTGAQGPPGPGQVQTTCVARSEHDQLDRWTKDARNPVTRAPEGISEASFRDPFVWRDGDRWLQMVGASIPNVGGAALLFASRDLVEWEPLEPLLTAADLPDGHWTGDMWECPALVRTPGGDALLISVHDGEHTTHHAAAIVGHLEGHRFVARNVHRLDLGPDLYAPCAYVDPDGRTIVWGWSWEARSSQRQQEAGWSGVLTLPRQVEVVDDRLRVRPIREVDGLRSAERSITRRPTADGWLVAGAEGDALDIVVALGPSVQRLDLVVRRSPDGEERATVRFDRSDGLWLDRDRASLDDQVVGGIHGAALAFDDGPIELRVIVDRSIVEVYAADHVVLTARIYPTRHDSTGVEVVGPAIDDEDVTVRVWELGSVWDPATS